MDKLKDLFNKQRPLDDKILDKYSGNNKVVKHDIYNNKLLALLVEVSELANETKCFKFWSEKQNKVTEKALEELVDCLHFILSLGNDCNLNEFADFNFKLVERKLRYRERISYNRTDHFISLISSIQKFSRNKVLTYYQEIIDDFIIIALDLKFTEEQIVNAYLDKNKVNHERQSSRY